MVHLTSSFEQKANRDVLGICTAWAGRMTPLFKAAFPYAQDSVAPPSTAGELPRVLQREPKCRKHRGHGLPPPSLSPLLLPVHSSLVALSVFSLRDFTGQTIKEEKYSEREEDTFSLRLKKIKA